ncbi:hypothetical protein Tco_0099953 [Tanacetum coccineum]
MSPIHLFPTEDMYSPQYLDFFQHTAREDSPVEVAAPPLKPKPTTEGRGKTQNKDAPRSTAWKNQEEIALCKGWVHESKNNIVGNARNFGLWFYGTWITKQRHSVVEVRYDEWEMEDGRSKRRVLESGAEDVTTQWNFLTMKLNTKWCLHFVIVGRYKKISKMDGY